MKMKLSLPEKVPLEESKNLLIESEQRMESFRKIHDDMTPSTPLQSYLNIYKYWNEFLIKGKLPTYKWLIDNIFKNSGTGLSIFTATSETGIFQFLSAEFVKEMAESIKKLKPKRIIEIGAGDGLLSHFLKKEGINIIPIDNRIRTDISYTDFVEELEHKKALKKYNPDFVVISWEEYESEYSIDILNHPTVKHILWIGEGKSGATGSEKLWKFRHKNITNGYCLARTDNMIMSGHNVFKHTGVWLFYPRTRKKSKN